MILILGYESPRKHEAVSACEKIAIHPYQLDEAARNVHNMVVSTPAVNYKQKKSEP